MKYAVLLRFRFLLWFALFVAGRIISPHTAFAASADLWQARNGTPDAPRSPVEWVRGNASPANSHYIEGQSIPYRMVMTGLSNGPHTLILEWDTRQKGKHAIDYITHYDRLAPHSHFGDLIMAEVINPLEGLPAGFGTPRPFPIPAPSPAGPGTGLPTTSFQSLPDAERAMSIWNGTITGLTYLAETSLDNDSAISRIAIEFWAENETVVLAWGGHIGSKLDWGAGNSASTIGGSPYHMRKIALDGAGGNQDRSVQAQAVASPPTSVVSGPSSVCAATTNTFVVTTDATDPATRFEWTVSKTTASATIVGPTDGASVDVVAAAEGSYVVQATVIVGKMTGIGRTSVIAQPSTSLAPLDNQTVCPGSSVAFRALPTGTEPFAFAWSKDGLPIPGATNSVLTLENLTVADTGRYCLDAIGTCGSASTCATLTVKPPPVLAGPPELTLQCLADVPPPDPASVVATGQAVPITVVHAGDVIVTNGCDILVRRTYEAVDACASRTSWVQLITVRDTQPPVFTVLPDRQVECGTDWSFAVPGVVDECDGADVTAVVVGTVTNGLCGITYTATRTWQATDRCGNSATTSQTIAVIDTTAPGIGALPGPTTIECPLPPEFAPATAADACDSAVTLTFTDVEIPGTSPGNYSVTRFWTATDACGNTSKASQTITVKDTTPPVVVCPADQVVHCTGPEGAAVTFEVTATDACDTNIQVTCLPPSGSVFPLGRMLVQCVAIDASANRGECSFAINVVDLEPPLITCPTDISVLEDKPESGQATVQFPSPLTSDNADPNPIVVCSPPSGSVFTEGTAVVRCVATDASGNTNACTFQVQVVPRTIVASSTADSGPGTLRQALLDANAAPGSNVIAFAFPGTPPFVIQLKTPLPEIVDPVVIDGWSQLEFRGLPIVELDGSNVVADATAPVTGLTIIAGASEVRGLVLNGFVVGLRVAGPGGNVIQGNFIGTNPTGAAGPGNADDGIQIQSPANLIGGESPAARNVIAGNHGNGLVFDGPNAVSNQVQGNWIGPVKDADAFPPEGEGEGGNGGNGVLLRNGAARNRIGPDNVIAFNRLNGVLLELTAANGNAIRRNRIFSNGAQGIDLGGDGPTPNDPLDTDDGPNRLQNHPDLTLAHAIDGVLLVMGTLDSATNAAFEIELFLNPVLNSAGIGQGRRFLALTKVTTDGTGHGSFSVTLPFPVLMAQFITATATDSDEDSSEFSPAAVVGGPPVILVQPAGTLTPPGTPVTFCVTAAGSPPLTYQWRLNGANIPDATNVCLTVLDAQPTNGGSYTVVVANDLGVVPSEPAVLRLILPLLQAGDNFVDRVRLTNNSGRVTGDNREATAEPGEPSHAGKPGGKSIWYTWTAPATGIATFSTIGSAFDTLLAVYKGQSVASLTNVASDEDRGGFFTSLLRFNAIAGDEYQIAVDGYGGASGGFVFNWSFEATDRLLPVIFDPPMSQTVAPGSSVTFQVDASVDCREPHFKCRRVNKDQPPEHPGDRDPLTYQWFFNGIPIPGATQSSFTVTNVQADAVGSYSVQVTGDGPTLETLPAILQINESGSIVQNVQAMDKFLDAATSPPLRLGNPLLAAPVPNPADPGEPAFAPAVVVRGYTSTQVFSTVGGTTSAGELLPCYGVGGASEWFAVAAEEPGLLYVNTDGSSYDTVLAVYSYSPTNGLALLGCDNNSGLDRRDSALHVPVLAGRTNFIVIDGYNGASGVASLHCTLVTPGSLTSIGMTAQRAFRLRLNGRPAMRFTLETSSNLVSWATLITTNSATSTFDYTDPRATNAPRRFYRALMLP